MRHDNPDKADSARHRNSRSRCGSDDQYCKVFDPLDRDSHVCCGGFAKASAADGEKPWSYILVPETDVQENFTVSGLMAKHTPSPDADLLSRYQFNQEHQGIGA